MLPSDIPYWSETGAEMKGCSLHAIQCTVQQGIMFMYGGLHACMFCASKALFCEISNMHGHQSTVMQRSCALGY
jgi:hypothetical protein